MTKENKESKEKPTTQEDQEDLIEQVEEEEEAEEESDEESNWLDCSMCGGEGYLTDRFVGPGSYRCPYCIS